MSDAEAAEGPRNVVGIEEESPPNDLESGVKDLCAKDEELDKKADPNLVSNSTYESEVTRLLT